MKFRNNATSHWPETTVLYQKENASIIQGKLNFIEAGTRGPTQYKNLSMNIIAPQKCGKHTFTFQLRTHTEGDFFGPEIPITLMVFNEEDLNMSTNLSDEGS